jgi:DNA modification methylase
MKNDNNDNFTGTTEIDEAYLGGSGTTCKIAQKYNRKYIGCDISQEYVNIALERLQNTK